MIFKKNHSTYMALLHLIDKVTFALNDNKFTCSIFIDLSKAFDTVNHHILLNKLYRYGFRDTTHKGLRKMAEMACFVQPTLQKTPNIQFTVIKEDQRIFEEGEPNHFCLDKLLNYDIFIIY